MGGSPGPEIAVRVKFFNEDMGLTDTFTLKMCPDFIRRGKDLYQQMLYTGEEAVYRRVPNLKEILIEED